MSVVDEGIGAPTEVRGARATQVTLEWHYGGWVESGGGPKERTIYGGGRG